MPTNFNCKNCNLEEKTPKTEFCKVCNSLQNEISGFNRYINQISDSKTNSRKGLFQKKYKTQYLLKLRKGLNQKIKISNMDLEHLYNDIEILLKRSSEITATYHCANQFHSLPKKYKPFLFISLNNILFDSVKKIHPNTLWFLFNKSCPWEQ